MFGLKLMFYCTINKARATFCKYTIVYELQLKKYGISNVKVKIET